MQDFAKLLGVSVKTLQRWDRGEKIAKELQDGNKSDTRLESQN